MPLHKAQQEEEKNGLQKKQNISPCLSSFCQGAKLVKTHIVTYEGPFKKIKEVGKAITKPYEGTLRSSSTSILEPLRGVDTVRRFNEKYDSRLYLVQYEPEDEYKRKPIRYSELTERRSAFSDREYSIETKEIADTVSYRKNIEKSKIYDFMNPSEGYRNKWIAMKIQRDEKKAFEKYKRLQKTATAALQVTFF